MQKAAEKIKILAPEDEVTRKFHNQAYNFMEFFNFLHDFHRGDYQESAKLVQ